MNNTFLSLFDFIGRDLASPVEQSILKFVAPASEIQFRKMLNMEEVPSESGGVEIQCVTYNHQSVFTKVTVDECGNLYTICKGKLYWRGEG